MLLPPSAPLEHWIIFPSSWDNKPVSSGAPHHKASAGNNWAKNTRRKAHHIHLLRHAPSRSVLLTDHKRLYQKSSHCEHTPRAAPGAHALSYWARDAKFSQGTYASFHCVNTLWMLKDLIDAMTPSEPESGSLEQMKFAVCHLRTYSSIPEEHVTESAGFMKTWHLGELRCGKQQ